MGESKRSSQEEGHSSSKGEVLSSLAAPPKKEEEYLPSCPSIAGEEETEKEREEEEGVNYFNLPTLSELEKALCEEETPIVVKMNHLYSVKRHGGKQATLLLLKSLDHEKESVLFRHEAAYVLGQLGSPAAHAFLENLLRDKHEDEMVRHEAAEALGAIGCEEALSTLKEMLGDETTPLPVRQTCELAVEALYRKTEKKKKKKDSENQIDSRHLSSIGGEEEKKEESKQQKSGKGVIDSLGPSSGTKEAKSREANTSSVRSEEYEWFRYEEDNEYRDAQFNTVDPSEPYPDCASRDVPWLAEQLMNPNEKLWNRYRSLFTLRNLNSPESITAIATALEKDTSSALLRHEIAFVLGQLRPCEAVCDLALQRDVKETEEEKRKLSPHTSPDSPSPSSSHSLADAETTAAASPVSQMSERACADTNKERGSEKDTVRGGLGGKEDENERKEVISKIIGVHTPEGAANVAANALITCLTNEREHSMARHEAALALGSLGASPEAGDIKWMNSDQTIRSLVIDTLQKYRYDTDRVVSESCLVGLDSMQDELGISLGV